MPTDDSRHPSNLADFDPRFPVMLETLRLCQSLIEDGDWYDFGCGFGWSSIALYELGARRVQSFEPNPVRVSQCPDRLHVSATDDVTEFDNVLSYGVLEHVYFDERRPILSSLWERLKPGGCMIIADTPNRLLPYDPHTTQLPLIPWLPAGLAESFANFLGRLPEDEWLSSGFRGLCAWDFSGLEGRIDRSPVTHRRHRLFRAARLHPHTIDPWPVWVWQKPE